MALKENRQVFNFDLNWATDVQYSLWHA